VRRVFFLNLNAMDAVRIYMYTITVIAGSIRSDEVPH